jgi:hypothetical protein
MIQISLVNLVDRPKITIPIDKRPRLSGERRRPSPLMTAEPRATPRMKAISATAGRPTGTEPLPTKAKAKNSRLPVARAVKTWPRARETDGVDRSSRHGQ